MSRSAGPFRPATVALLLLVGAGAFLLLLYALGKGWTGDDESGGGAHAGSKGLNGYAGLVQLLETNGQTVSLSRNPGDLEDYSLVVLTPPHFADPAEIDALLEQRRYVGPTMLVLPKWQAMPIDEQQAEAAAAGEDWVQLGTASSPGWFSALTLAKGSALVVGTTRGWEASGVSGTLAEPASTQALVEQPDLPLDALVVDSEGDTLAGLSYYDGDEDAWPVLVVFEPDLLNNYGLADQQRAAMAVELVKTAADFDPDVPIVFDLTFAGLGTSENLLTLAFTPPFLAATLCLLLAALVIAWRGFKRFGPPVAEVPALAQGKAQLARNGAALLGRVRRWHLLAEPFAALITARIAAMLAIRETAPEARDAAIERALVRAGHSGTSFAQAAHTMRNSRKPGEILRAARALKSIERMLKR
jgi:hypothetical protein